MSLNRKLRPRNDNLNTLKHNSNQVSTRVMSMGGTSELQEIMQKSDYENLSLDAPVGAVSTRSSIKPVPLDACSTGRELL